MKKKILLLLSIFVTFQLFSQSIIDSEKEVLATFQIGTDINEMLLNNDEEPAAIKFASISDTGDIKLYHTNGKTYLLNKSGLKIVEEPEKNDIRFLNSEEGKLKSGHNVFFRKSFGKVMFDYTDQNENVILSQELNDYAINADAFGNKKVIFKCFIGNYGEIYAIQAETYASHYHYFAKEGTTAEFIVIRNQLKNFGILNDDRIRLRKGPGTDTESLGTYPIKTGFQILEDSCVKQTIEGVTKTWIKVRLLDGTEGYFFGQYVQNLYDGPGTSLPWSNVAD